MLPEYASTVKATVASLASHNRRTMLWARREGLADEINREHTNERYLPGFRLPKDLAATDSIEEAVRNADVVVVGVPSHGVRAVLTEAARSIRPWVPVTP